MQPPQGIGRIGSSQQALGQVPRNFFQRSRVTQFSHEELKHQGFCLFVFVF